MESLTSQIMIKALDGLNARSIVTSFNIANASTVGYRPLRISFERALSDAAALGPDAVRSVQAKVDYPAGPGADGQLRLDTELATASTTALRYSALLDLLNRQLQLHATAMMGNR